MWWIDRVCAPAACVPAFSLSLSLYCLVATFLFVLIALFLCFAQVHELEKELVSLVCESFSTNCAVNLGWVTHSIYSKAKVAYPVHVRAQKAAEREEKKKNERASIATAWQSQLRSSNLTRYLLQKDTETRDK